MEYIYGIYMEYIYIWNIYIWNIYMEYIYMEYIYMEYIWNIYGIYMEYIWNIWNIYGIFMGYDMEQNTKFNGMTSFSFKEKNDCWVFRQQKWKPNGIQNEENQATMGQKERT